MDSSSKPRQLTGPLPRVPDSGGRGFEALSALGYSCIDDRTTAAATAAAEEVALRRGMSDPATLAALAEAARTAIECFFTADRIEMRDKPNELIRSERVYQAPDGSRLQELPIMGRGD